MAFYPAHTHDEASCCYATRPFWTGHPVLDTHQESESEPMESVLSTASLDGLKRGLIAPPPPGLEKLRRLYVWRTAVTRGGAARLKKGLPQLKIIMGVDLSQLPATPPSESRSRPKGELTWMVLNPNQTPPNSKTASNTRVVFQNRMKTSVKLIWISYSGEQKLYGVLTPSATQDQNTYSNATWLITDLSDIPLGHFRRGTAEAVAVIPARR